MIDKTNNDISPCPVCGSEDVYWGISSDNTLTIECGECEAYMQLCLDCIGNDWGHEEY
ncbi:MAG: hypothetical protein GXZ11_01460 [Tissierellia bacterium]|nr:hypothetical protein [Tissierellia bacterium]